MESRGASIVDNAGSTLLRRALRILGDFGRQCSSITLRDDLFVGIFNLSPKKKEERI